MKTKKELQEEATYNGNWQTSSGAKATLEVLCDIRLFLANLNHGQGFGNSKVLNRARELIIAENPTINNDNKPAEEN